MRRENVSSWHRVHAAAVLPERPDWLAHPGGTTPPRPQFGPNRLDGRSQ
jgi:hypothetical protein